MRVSVASQDCEGKYISPFHNVAANFEKDLEGQERESGHPRGRDGVDAMASMFWVMKLGF